MTQSQKAKEVAELAVKLETARKARDEAEADQSVLEKKTREVALLLFPKHTGR